MEGIAEGSARRLESGAGRTVWGFEYSAFRYAI